MNTDGSSHYVNLSLAELAQHAISGNEGQFSERGTLVVPTRRGQHVARYLVNEPSVTDILRSDTQFQFLEDADFKSIWANVTNHIIDSKRYRLNAQLGIKCDIAVPLEITTLKAWQAMSCHHLCHIPTKFNALDKPVWKLIWVDMKNLSESLSIESRGGITLTHVGKRKVLICGDLTVGEMRRTLFTILGLLLPEKSILPIHGAAAEKNGTVTLFLGPAGAKKTTWALRCGHLFADRALSWSQEGLHRLADGCRLHLNNNLPINLDETLPFGTIAEKPKLEQPLSSDCTTIDFNRDGWTHLVAPLSLLGSNDQSDIKGPSQLVILTTDPLGVLPPIARISSEQALVWFLLGYGNYFGPSEGRDAEVDIRFTSGFLEPLVSRNLNDYILILEDLLLTHNTRCFIINGGWHGNNAGKGESLSTSEERAVLKSMHYCNEWQALGYLGLSIPSEKSKSAGPWHPQDRWIDQLELQQNIQKLKRFITDQIIPHKSAERWLKALDLI